MPDQDVSTGPSPEQNGTEHPPGPAVTGDELGALMRSVQAGDSAAYERLLREIAPRIRQTVQRRRSFMAPEDIEDLVQEVLLSVHAVRATYDPGRPFLPWLFAIIRNRLADGARRYARKEAKEIIVEDLEVTFASTAPNIDIDARRRSRTLIEAIGQLPARQRSAIELLKLREMSLKEASAASGMSIGALKVATYRAIAALRKIMANEE